MKHFKSLLTIVVLALALTSCMDNDPTQNGVYVGRAEYGTAGYQFDVYGLKMIPTSQALLTQENISNGDIAFFSFSYNSDEQSLTSETKSLTVDITGVMNCGNKRVVSNTDNGAGDAAYENATIVNLSENNGYVNGPFVHYGKDRDILIVPMYFLAKSDLSKHTFNLIYNESEVKTGDKELKLYLRHISSEEAPSSLGLVIKAFNINEALYRFKDVAGSAPTKITILTNETNDMKSDKLEDAKDEPQSYSIDYKLDE